MASALFSPDDEKFISTYPLAEVATLRSGRASLPKGSVDHDIDADRFLDVLYSLCKTEPARHIRLVDSLDSLAVRLYKFAIALIDRATFPTTLWPYCSSLFEKLASSDASDLDLWTAVAQLLVAFDSPRVPSTRTPPEDNNSDTEPNSSIILGLYKSWTSDYVPASLEALQDLIRSNESWGASEFYAKTLIFVQGSGMGKSRLADAFGKECPMINFVLRDEAARCYPPADSEVLSFMCKRLPVEEQRKIMDSLTEEEDKSLRTPKTKDEMLLESMAVTVWDHSIAMGLLQASFEIFNAWAERQNSEISLKKLAATRHEMMAPYKHANTVDWHRRSNYRANFCRSIVSRAEEIANTLIHNQNWRHAFYVGKDSKAFLQLPLSSAFDSLQRKAHELTQTLESFPHENGEPLLVMVFDEARSLLKSDISGEPDFGRYHALNRIISYLKEFPMWFFFPSTDSQVGMLISADDMEVRRVCDRSARIAFTGGYPFRCFPPFVGLRVDVEDRKRMRDPDSRTKELHKKMNDFTQPKHMAMFGRPLWFGYNPAKMNQLAKAKLVGGGEWARYNAGDVHHVFAALSFRLSLDFNLQNPKAHSLARIAVRSFMRVVISMDQETGVLDTITPSEPVVAEAAMEHLCKNRNWSESIETLTEKLLDKGLIDKGLKGELYSRFVLILARDWLQKNASPTSVPKLQATFTVQQFLMALYNDHESVLLIPRKIREAWMNFNHFVSTKEHLTPKVIPGLLHDLLRRRAAIQLARNQPTYDKLIPIYFGNPDEPFDVSCCGVILVLDRNNDRVTTPRNIFETTFTAVNPEHESQPIPKAANSIRNGSYFLLNEMTNPVLFLLFDLGVTQHTYAPSAPVQVSHTSGRTPVVWAIHSHGHDREVFGCLGHMRCNDASGWFFTSLETEKNEHNELCRRNDIFSELERNFRYSGFDEVHVAKRKWDGEEDIESRDKDGDTQVEDV